ncbi:MAG TPA: hypothetical protein VJI71_01145 [Candidatus Norongarragalinales archaeon]|nr:hypothetical protein [Candidatus Norongarragalinales archaeon]
MHAQFEKTLARLNTPPKIQDYLDSMQYNKGETAYSAFKAFSLKKAHCLEGALIAAAALEKHGFPPLLVDLIAVRDEDHIIVPFQLYGKWGSIAKSNFSGLRYREPVFSSIRELVLSYFDHYYNFKKRKTLRYYSEPLDLNKTGLDWKYSEKPLHKISDLLAEQPRFKTISAKTEKVLRKADERIFKAGLVGRLK